MTLERTVTLRCGCGAPQSLTLYQTLNVSLNPELKKRLLEGELNVLVCSACGETSQVNAPLLYHDMKARRMVQVVPDGRERSAVVADTLKSTSSMVGEAYTLRVVFSRDELVEKVLVWDAGLDDRVVELVKLVARAQQDLGSLIDRFLFDGVSDGAGGREIRFFFVGPEGPMSGLVPISLYDDTATRFATPLAAGPELASLIVDQDLAVRVLASA